MRNRLVYLTSCLFGTITVSSLIMGCVTSQNKQKELFGMSCNSLSNSFEICLFNRQDGAVMMPDPRNISCVVDYVVFTNLSLTNDLALGNRFQTSNPVVCNGSYSKLLVLEPSTPLFAHPSQVVYISVPRQDGIDGKVVVEQVRIDIPYLTEKQLGETKRFYEMMNRMYSNNYELIWNRQ